MCLTGFNVGHRETFAHLYFDCTCTSNLMNNFCARYLPGVIDRNDRISKLFYSIDEDGNLNIADAIFHSLFLYEIWLTKIKKGRTSFATLVENLLYSINGIITCKKDIELFALNSNNVWCREWRDRHWTPRW